MPEPVRKVTLPVPPGGRIDVPNDEEIMISHGLETEDIAGVVLRDVATKTAHICAWRVFGSNSIGLRFGSTVRKGQFEVVISG